MCAKVQTKRRMTSHMQCITCYHSDGCPRLYVSDVEVLLYLGVITSLTCCERVRGCQEDWGSSGETF